ncbi:tyrosine-type recombinase/integrase [Castellaniella sp.]|uniref:tyrosine-type recombinase/integrase n=1 Tax=Castellaniella sp. TaxID=1955812 RepID=UPI002AFF6F6B|nr:tyrosine-type recombinase/integrase [Castellaniella sp.]
MGRTRKQGGIYPMPNGTYDVDTTYRRQRIRGSGFESHREAEDFLIGQKQSIKSETTAGVRRLVTLDEAAAKYIQEQADVGKPSWGNDASMLRPVVAMKGSLTIDLLGDDSLADFVQARLDQGRKATTINRTLAVVRAICNRAATVWKFENGLTWLDRAPRITLLDESDKRPPRPLAWAEQPQLLAQLPDHLAAMALFDLNSGVREDVICSLRWEWEARVLLRKDLMISVFVVPRDHVKGRKQERVLICNSIAQRIVDEQRSLHPEYVFTYPSPKGRGKVERHPVQHINNSAWQKARARAGLGDLHVHDLRHTVGMRLRSMGVSPRTQDAILWHASGEMTDHYAIAQLREVYDALELITRPSDDFETLDLHALIRRTKMQRFTEKTPDKEKAALRNARKAA